MRTVVSLLIAVMFTCTSMMPSAGASVSTSTQIFDYAFPCKINLSGNWSKVRKLVTRNQSRVVEMTDRELLDDINNNGRYGHFTKDAQGNRIAEIDISDNPNNPAKGTVRNYGVCEDRVLRASKKGIVFRSYQDNYGAWIISIKHDNDQVSSYGHLAVKSPLNPGTPVEEGDAIGTMGCTGSCTGIHVHFDVSIGNTKVDNWRFKLLPDTTAPSGGFQSPVQGATVQRYVDLQGSGIDTGSGIGGAYFTANLYGTQNWAILSPTLSGNSFKYTVDLCMLDVRDGVVEFGLDIWDSVGNRSYSPGGVLRVNKLFNCGTACALKSRGDVNCDGKINLTDFERWRSEYGARNSTRAGDLDHNGEVALRDFEIFRRGYNGLPASQVNQESQPTPAIVFFQQSTITTTLAMTISVDVYVKSQDDARFSGAAFTVGYDPAFLAYQDITDEPSASCIADGWLGEPSQVVTEPMSGTVTLSVPRLGTNNSLPLETACLGTVSFRWHDELPESIRTQLKLTANPKQLEIVGPGADFIPEVDEARNNILLTIGEQVYVPLTTR